jgi:hypothetical protein
MFGIVVLDKGKPARLTRIPIKRHKDPCDGPDLREVRRQIRLGSFVWKVSDKQAASQRADFWTRGWLMSLSF